MTYDSTHPGGKNDYFRACDECGARGKLYTVDGDVLCLECV